MTKEYSSALVSLLKGVVYSDNEELWELVVKYEGDIRKYFNDIHLDLYIDKPEGYAFLKQRRSTEDDEENGIPKLMERRQLDFKTSLLCLLLRKHLIESDNEGNSSRVILSREEIINLMKPFMKDTTDEVKQEDQIKAVIKKVADEGFLRKLNNEDNLYEIRRIIKAFIDAEAVHKTLERYSVYQKEK